MPSLQYFLWKLKTPPLKTVSQALWIVFSGWELCLAYALTAILIIPTIIGIPFFPKLIELAIFSLNPIGREVVPNPRRADLWYHDQSNPIVRAMNAIWLVLFGWEFFLFHCVLGILQAVTVFGLGNAFKHFKIARATLFPFGTVIVAEPSPIRPQQ